MKVLNVPTHVCPVVLLVPISPPVVMFQAPLIPGHVQHYQPEKKVPFVPELVQDFSHEESPCSESSTMVEEDTLSECELDSSESITFKQEPMTIELDVDYWSDVPIVSVLKGDMTYFVSPEVYEREKRNEIRIRISNFASIIKREGIDLTCGAFNSDL
jgi:hypothetical protein